MNKLKRNFNVWGIATIIVLVITCVLTIKWVLKNAEYELRSNLLNHTMLVEQAANVHQVQLLSGTLNDLNTPNYNKLFEYITFAMKTNAHCKYIYIMGRKPDGNIIFYLDSDDKNPALPGTIYKEASNELKNVFVTGIPIVEGPLPDRWGAWVSALVPVKDNETGKVIAILGEDIDASKWNENVIETAAIPLLIIFTCFVIVIILLLIFQNNITKNIFINESRLRNAEIISNSGNWELYLDSYKINCSVGALQICELDKYEFDYSKIRELILPQYQEELNDAKMKLKNDGIVYDVDFEIKTAKTGKKKYIRSIARYDRKKRIVFGVIQDITEQKNNERELIIAKEKAMESDRLKTAFIKNISHEIRTPLNAIMGFSEILPNNFENKVKLEKYTTIIKNRGADLLFLINDILDISILETSPTPIKVEKFYLNQFFDELETYFFKQQQILGKSNIQLQTNINCKKQSICTDHEKLKHIFCNLIQNALKFTDSGKIELGCSENDNNNIVFYVSDTGIGIPEDMQKSIFESFRQVDYSERKINSGTGLGLSIVNGLVKQLQGSISVKSEVDKGSVFYFTVSS